MLSSNSNLITHKYKNYCRLNEKARNVFWKRIAECSKQYYVEGIFYLIPPPLLLKEKGGIRTLSNT
jgi:hypothetical protein